MNRPTADREEDIFPGGKYISTKCLRHCVKVPFSAHHGSRVGAIFSPRLWQPPCSFMAGLTLMNTMNTAFARLERLPRYRKLENQPGKAGQTPEGTILGAPGSILPHGQPGGEPGVAAGSNQNAALAWQ